MTFLQKFIKLMKNESTNNKKTNTKKTKPSWIIDESKCLGIKEVKKLRQASKKGKMYGLENDKFTPIRTWFMLELGLNAGLRVEEMASLKHGNLLIERERSSIVVIGKGNKKRAIWINSDFKKTCKTYIDYKKRFGYSTDEDSFLLNNLKGTKITKRALQKFFKFIIKKAGLSEHYYIHCLRHTYTTFLLKASNYNYRFAQQQLGHASIRTTQTYASVLDSEGRKAVEQLYK
jgi:site-specific recombinase XerD